MTFCPTCGTDTIIEAIRECQSALAMMIAPDAIKQTTVLYAFAQATAAEAKARAALASIPETARGRADLRIAELDAAGIKTLGDIEPPQSSGERAGDADTSLYQAVLSCPHEIEDGKIVLRYSPKQGGHNALSQLASRIRLALSAALARPAEGWRPMESAPKDGTHILLLTSDFGAVEGWWDVDVTNFYKSQEGWASYDPDDAQGDWVSDWRIDPSEARLFCGATPTAWHPLPSGALIIAEIDRIDRLTIAAPATGGGQ